MKVVAIVLLLVALCCAEIPQNVMNGYYPGRSGDLFIFDKKIQSEESIIVLFGDDNKLLLPDTMSETDVAQILTQILTLPSLTPESDNFQINSKYFDQPKANVYITVQSKSGVLNIAQGKQQSKVTVDSVPYSPLAHMTSMVTGVTPSSHGIVGSTWLDKAKERTVYAYSSWNPAASGSFAPNVQDTLNLISEGQSLIFSASSCKMMARAISPKPFVTDKKANNFGIYWNGGAADSVYDDDVTKLVMTKKSIIASLIAEGLIEVDETTFYLTFGSTKVGFDLKIDFALLFEYSLAHVFSEQLTGGLFSELIKDGEKDLYSFGFASIGDIENNYGEQSNQFKAALSLVNTAVESIIEAVDSVYEGVVMKQVVRINAVQQNNNKEEKITDSLIDTLNKDHMPVYAVKTFYPQVYLAVNVPVRDKICADVNKVVSSFGVEAECMPESETSYVNMELDSSEGDSDSATFQISLWITVALIFASFGGSVVMLTVDASSDSLLYSQDIDHPNPVNNLMHTPAAF